MPDFKITNLRGGLNNSDPPSSIPDDQVTEATNVEFVTGTCGERRLGGDVIDITGSNLVGKDRVPFIYRHLPGVTDGDAEFWAFGVTSTTSSALVRKTTSWSTISPADSITITGTYQYQLAAASLHGKMFLAYKSSANRLHVWDGSALRRTGLAEPAAPAVADSAPAGSFAGTRYYRVRYTVQSAGTTLRRSEPSDVTTFAPLGTRTGAVITKPATISENETHWEIEASVDNANFYVIATIVVGTTTYTDTTAFTPGYADTFELAPDIEDYALIPSARFIAVDDDRLIWAGSFEDSALASRVGWTPVNRAEGEGNDERMETDTDPFIDLDGLEGGAITGMITGVQGYIYVFKFKHIYQLVRTGQRSKAYQAYNITKDRGAIEGSIVTGLDHTGRPVVYFLDPFIGPCFFSGGEVFSCGADVRTTWESVNLDATNIIARTLYFPTKRQIRWVLASGSANIPDIGIVLHTNRMRNTQDGVRGGWAYWTGGAVAALSMCLFSDNIDDNTTRSRNLVPFIGKEGSGLIWRLETTDEDNGTEYDASITTKPFALAGMTNQFGVVSTVVLTKAVTDATIDVGLIKDFGVDTVTVPDSSCTPIDAETQIIHNLKDLQFSEMRTAQIQIGDSAAPGERWEINEIIFRYTPGQKS